MKEGGAEPIPPPPPQPGEGEAGRGGEARAEAITTTGTIASSVGAEEEARAKKSKGERGGEEEARGDTEGARRRAEVEKGRKAQARAEAKGGGGGPSAPAFLACLPAAMASPNAWVLLGLGIAGLFFLSRSRKKPIPKDFRAFLQYLELPPPPQPAPPIAPHPLSNLAFAITDIFDVEGFVTGFGNPDWARTHEAASRTAPAVAILVRGGATCVGKTHMDELAYGNTGENKHYGTPVNPAVTSRVPGGSSSGAAVAVAAGLVDFALGTDNLGSVRIPAAYCGILGFRPSYGAVSSVGIVPVSQSLDTVGLFARDPSILRTVGHVLLQQPYSEIKQLRRVIIPDDCFQISSVSEDQHVSVALNSIEKTFGRPVIVRLKLGEYFASKIPSLKSFQTQTENGKVEPSFSALKSLKNAMQLLQRYEFKTSHEDWLSSVKPDLGSGIAERVKAALQTSSELVAEALKVRDEARVALSELLMNDGILVMPTAPGPPPKLCTKGPVVSEFWERALTLLSVACLSGGCEVSVPIGKYDGSPTAISLIAKHGADRFLLDSIKVLFMSLQKEAEAYLTTRGAAVKATAIPEAAEVAKEKGNVAFKNKDYRAAIECYSEAIRMDGKNATYFNNRAAAYLSMCSFQQAESDCSMAINLDNKNVKAYLRRGTAREFLGYYKEADEDFRQALVLEPTNKTAGDAVRRLKKLLYE